MPDSRRDYYRELDAIGAEPVSAREMPAQWKENVEYQKHVAAGGVRDSSFEREQHPAGNKKPLTVSEQLRKSNVKIG